MTLLAAVALAAVFTSGCAGPEQKLGMGMSNTFEFARLGEMRRTVEQTAIFESPGQAYTTGMIRGFDRSIGRTAMGVYEIATFPIPPYHPVLTHTFKTEPVFPESYKPGLVSDTLFDTDTYMGYSGGDVAPWLIGSRFKVFDN